MQLDLTAPMSRLYRRSDAGRLTAALDHPVIA